MCLFEIHTDHVVLEEEGFNIIILICKPRNSESTPVDFIVTVITRNSGGIFREVLITK